MRPIYSIAGAAALALAAAGGPSLILEEPPPPRNWGGGRTRRYRGNGCTKKTASGLYKGSRWAKRASKRGGNPEAHRHAHD